GAVGTFTDMYTGQTASDFTAIIDWGDGTTSAGTFSGSNGDFTVSGSHTYADEGTYPVHIFVRDDAADALSNGPLDRHANVVDGDSLSATGLTFSAIEQNPFSGNVATFSDTNTLASASDFTATIDWGDGTTSAGTVAGANGNFTVSGNHTYAEDGSYPVSV